MDASCVTDIGLTRAVAPPRGFLRQLGALMSFVTLVAHDLTKAYGARTVIDGVTLSAAPGQRIGLVGENGVGKSTLLRLFAGVESPDTGSVDRPDDLAYLPQEPCFPPDATIGSVLDEALAPLHAAVRDVEVLGSEIARHSEDVTLATAYGERLDWAIQHEAWDVERRAKMAAHRLGLDRLDPARQAHELSGGQRTRLALAALITRRPACALLDEPTNHLDDTAMELLEEYLVDLPGAVVAASHDRVFLDRACTHIVDLDPSHFGVDGQGGTRYGGGFSDFLAHKRDARRRWEETYRIEQERMAGLRRATATTARDVAHNRPPRDGDRYIYGFKGANVERSIARRVRNASMRLERLEREQVRKPPKPLRFCAPLTDGRYQSLLAVSVRRLRVEGRVDVHELDVLTGDRLLVTGANGSGKSSLLSVLAGRLEPDEGSVVVHAKRTGYLEQDVAFSDVSLSAVETFARALAPGAEGRSLAELGLLHPRELTTPVQALSVGQRRRLALAILVAQSPSLLLLDEPTNHISLALAGELEDAFSVASGTVVVASHDRWLRQRWEGSVLLLA